MTATETRTAEQVAEANARRKAKAIAEFAWRLGISYDELGTLEYSDRHDRHKPTLRRFAAAAFRAAGVDENVPHSRTSDTWRYLRGELVELADRERFGFDPPPARDLLEQRGQWIAEAWPAVDPMHETQPPPLSLEQRQRPPRPPGLELEAGETIGDREVAVAVALADAFEARPRRVRPSELAPYAAGDAPALVTSGCPPHVRDSTTDPPRGWLELAALGPLPGRSCRWCGAVAVVGTLNGWRCAQHWPWPGDPKGDWGWQLNWSPGPNVGACLASRCYCGRCAHYDVTGQPVRSLRGGE
jgi:hypothetical protein